VYKENNFNREQYIKYILLIENLSFPNSVQILYSANNININKTRDVKDDRILNSAIINNVDFLITNDKDLLEFQATEIKISTPSQFIAFYKK
jgi:putative PIN family toxin of toxin-antitoxin system